jgi:hypothetical protein
MRGGERLLLDLYDRPEAVRAAMEGLERAVLRFHEAWWPAIEGRGQRGHTVGFMRMWSPGRSNVIQLDLLALLAPEHLREFFYRELEAQNAAFEQSVFHLDGPDAIKHLPVLYDLFGRCGASPEATTKSSLTVIQWEYGAGNGPMTRWMPLLKEIQSHGVGLQLGCRPDEVETLMRELSAKRLFLSTRAASREEADDLMRLVARRTRE